MSHGFAENDLATKIQLQLCPLEHLATFELACLEFTMGYRGEPHHVVKKGDNLL